MTEIEKAINEMLDPESRAHAVLQEDRRKREDRQALLNMTGNIASGYVVACGVTSTSITAAEIAKASVALARAILEEVDRGEQ